MLVRSDSLPDDRVQDTTPTKSSPPTAANLWIDVDLDISSSWRWAATTANAVPDSDEDPPAGAAFPSEERARIPRERAQLKTHAHARQQMTGH